MRLEQKIATVKGLKADIVAKIEKHMVEAGEAAADVSAYEAWQSDYAALEGELQKAAEELKSLEARQAEMASRAKRVDELLAEEKELPAADEKGASPVNAEVSKPAIAKGMAKKLYEGDVEVRRLLVDYMAHKHKANAVDVAASMFPNDARIQAVVRAPILVPTSTTAGTAAELVVQQDAQNELIDLLRNELIAPRMPGMRTLPLESNKGSIRIPRVQSAIAAGWVGEGVSIPVSRPTFDSVVITPYKLATITMMTRELMERSDPAYETIVRDQLIQSIAQAVDTSFISDVAGTATSPAGLLNGLAANAVTMPAAPTAAQAIAVVNALKLELANANIPMTDLVWIMPIRTMYGLMSLRSAIDTPLFPELAAGQWQGIPVITSNNVPLSLPVGAVAPIILAKTSEIWFGLGKGISLSFSDQAYIQHSDFNAPGPTTPPTNGVSLFQQEMAAIRCVYDTTWARRRDEAFAWTSTAL